MFRITKASLSVQGVFVYAFFVEDNFAKLWEVNSFEVISSVQIDMGFRVISVSTLSEKD